MGGIKLLTRDQYAHFSRLPAWIASFGVWVFVLFAFSPAASAQFKTIGPAPFSPAVARGKVKALLETARPGTSAQTIQKLSDLLAWYRDIIDDELIAAWRNQTRENLIEVTEALADSRVAVAVVHFSWREQRQAALRVTDAPMLGHLMVRFPESAQPFLDDLLGRPTPDLSEPEAEAVCRILMDMPDVGTWRSSALQILPHYRQAAETLLAQDLRGSDKENRFQALRWENDLGWDANEQASVRRRAPRSPSPGADRASNGDRNVFVLSPPAEADRASEQVATNSPPARPPLVPAPVPPAPVVSAAQYAGPRSGTIESTGGPIPGNAEYVFRNLPAVKIQLDYDTKLWDARLAAGEGQTQRLIVKNKRSSPQKRCVVHWSVIP